MSIVSGHKRKNLVILGSTGSIGMNALRVAAAFPERFRVIGLAAQSRVELLLRQARQFKVKNIALADENAARRARQLADGTLNIMAGVEGMENLAALEKADIVLVAVVGIAGLRPMLAALRRGTDVAVATKEALVAAGCKVTALSRARGGRILPVDSEHSAIFQCLQGCPPEAVRRIILTASGGPFAARKRLNLERVTVAETLRHPRWNMGRKITVDSATMMNKGLELIEARWLFNMPPNRIDIVLHPESIVHSLVEFNDGNLLAQLSVSDMRFAIQYALTYPERLNGRLPSLNLAQLGQLHFAPPDLRRFPCLALARAAAEKGGSMPAALNAANETAVESFLDGRIALPAIGRIVEAVMNRHNSIADPGLADILETDSWARRTAAQLIAGKNKISRKKPARQN